MRCSTRLCLQSVLQAQGCDVLVLWILQDFLVAFGPLSKRKRCCCVTVAPLTCCSLINCCLLPSPVRERKNTC